MLQRQNVDRNAQIKTRALPQPEHDRLRQVVYEGLETIEGANERLTSRAAQSSPSPALLIRLRHFVQASDVPEWRVHMSRSERAVSGRTTMSLVMKIKQRRTGVRANNKHVWRIAHNKTELSSARTGPRFERRAQEETRDDN